MGSVTVNSPSEQVIKHAQAEVEITDARDRKIVLRKPGVLAQYRFIDMLGQSASNQVYVSMVLPLIFVASIDGDAVSQPTRRSELDALIMRLDEEGIVAISKGVESNFGASDPEADKDALKK